MHFWSGTQGFLHHNPPALEHAVQKRDESVLLRSLQYEDKLAAPHTFHANPKVPRARILTLHGRTKVRQGRIKLTVETAQMEFVSFVSWRAHQSSGKVCTCMSPPLFQTKPSLKDYQGSTCLACIQGRCSQSAVQCREVSLLMWTLL